MTAGAGQKPAQLVLDLPHRQALGAEDFLVSRSNEVAVALVDAWPEWPGPAVLVCGPQGSGKSHLANVWRLRSGAQAVTGAGLSETAIGDLEFHRALVVEDIDRGIACERTLFHVLNLAREQSHFVLLTTRTPPGDIEVPLPDLRSRLRALPLVTLDAPDEPLLKGVLVKLFSDRQLAIEPHVVAFLALRMERSLEAASRVVAAVDRLSLALQRRVTRSVAAEALEVVADGENAENSP
jgi:chromosomal replication initiation ATPase DnaA